MRKQGGKKAQGAKNRMNERMGPQERRWGREMTGSEKNAYGEAMKAARAAFGLTDGLKCSQDEFHDYLSRRRAEDEARRGARVRRPVERQGRQYPTTGEVRVYRGEE